MANSLVGEDEKTFTVNDGRTSFKVPKSGLSEQMAAKIRGLANKMSSNLYGYPASSSIEEIPMSTADVDPMAFPERKDAGPTVYDATTGETTQVPAGQSFSLASPDRFDSGAGLPSPMAQNVADYAAVRPNQGNPSRGSSESVFERLKRAWPGPSREGMSAMDEENQLVNMPTDAAMRAEAAKPKSLVTREEFDKRPATEASPAAPASIRPMGGGSPGAGDADLRAGFDARRAAAEQEGQLKAVQATARAGAIDAFATKQGISDMQARQRSEAAQAQAQSKMSQLQSAQDEMRNVNTTVDPGRYWASKNTGQKILGIIGLALGAFGTKGGINEPARMMQQAIDRDIDAQKTEHTLALQLGKSKVDAAQSGYAVAHQIVQDDAAATSAERARAFDVADLELKKVMATTEAPLALANGQALSAHLQTQKAEALKDAAYKTAQISHLNAESAHLRQTAAGASGMTPEMQNATSTARQKATHIANNAAKLASLIDKYGTDEVMTPGVSEEMDLLSTSLATDMGAMSDPKTGVRDAEMEKWSKVMFKRGYIQRDTNAKAALKNVADYAIKRYGEDAAAVGKR